jgi:hypothetical protein
VSEERRQQVRREHIDSDIVRCTQHGSSPFCWIQSNGEHINDSRCHCLSSSPASCPVDAHRREAGFNLDLLNLVKRKGGTKKQ